MLLRSSLRAVSAAQVELASHWTRDLRDTWQAITAAKASDVAVIDLWDGLTLTAEDLAALVVEDDLWSATVSLLCGTAATLDQDDARAASTTRSAACATAPCRS